MTQKVFSFLFLCITLPLLSKASVYSPKEKSHTGILVTTNNDTLRGNISLDEFKGINLTIHVLVQNGKTKKYIPEDQVQYIKVEGCDTSISKKGYTEFFKLKGLEGLHRQIYVGKAKYYDNSHYVDEYPRKIGSNIYIKYKSDIYPVKHRFYQISKLDLLQYTNKHLHTHFKDKDFKREIDIIAYIDQSLILKQIAG